MKYLIVLGGGVMQEPVLSICSSIDTACIVLDKNDQCLLALKIKAGNYPNCEFENVDISDKDAVYNTASKYKQAGKLHGIITVGTDFSRTVAFACEKLGLTSMSYQSSINCSVKSVMRKCFEDAGVNCPKFRKVTSSKELDNLLSNNPLSYPLVIKPVDNMGGRGTKLVYTDNELKDAYNVAFGFTKLGEVIIEEYIDRDPNGDGYEEYSLDSIVYDGKIHVKGCAIRHIKYPPYFIEIGHTMPALLSDEDYDIMVSEFRKGIRALGINIGCGKGDVFYSKKLKKAMIGEIAGRLSGGFMSGWTYPYSSGDNVILDAVMIALGQKPILKERERNYTCVERAIISIDGIVDRVDNNNANIPSMPSNLNFLFLNIKQGSIVSFPQNNVQKCGNFIFASESREHAISYCEDYISNINIKLDNTNKLTIDYLTDYKGKDVNKTQWAYPSLIEYFKKYIGDTIIDEKLLEQESKNSGKNFGNLLKLIENFEEIQYNKDWNFKTLKQTINTARGLYSVDFNCESLSKNTLEQSANECTNEHVNEHFKRNDNFLHNIPSNLDNTSENSSKNNSSDNSSQDNTSQDNFGVQNLNLAKATCPNMTYSNAEYSNYDRVFMFLVSKAGYQGASFFFEEVLRDPIRYFNILLGVKLVKT